VEPLEKSWHLRGKPLTHPLSNLFGIRVLFDPDLDFSSYPLALTRFETVSTWDFDSHQILASKKKRDQIAAGFSDIMNVDFIEDLEREYEKQL